MAESQQGPTEGTPKKKTSSKKKSTKKRSKTMPPPETDSEPSLSEEGTEEGNREVTGCEISTLTNEQQSQIEALKAAGIQTEYADYLVREAYESLSWKVYRALKGNHSVDYVKLGLSQNMRELKGYLIANTDGGKGTFLENLPKDLNAITLYHIDTVVRDLSLLDNAEESVIQRTAKAWAGLRPETRRPLRALRATNRQYQAFEDILMREAKDEAVREVLSKPLDLGTDASGLDFWDDPPTPGESEDKEPRDSEPDTDEANRDYDETKLDWEFTKIRETLRVRDSLTSSQLKWLSRNIGFADDFDEYEAEKVGECRAMEILLEEGDPRRPVKDSPCADLDKWLIKELDWASIVHASETLKRMIQLLRKANPDPLNPESWERNDIPATGGPAHAPNDYFELTIFEQYFQSRSREQSVVGDEESGAYSGMHGAELTGPKKGLQRLEDEYAMEGDGLSSVDSLTGELKKKIDGTVELPDNPTYPGSANELSVIASYQGKYLRTEDGERVRIVLADRWFLKVWRDRSDGARVPNLPMRVVRKKTRLCNLMEPRENTEQLGARLPLQAPTGDDPRPGLYTGICCLNGQFVYMYPIRDPTKTVKPDSLGADNLAGVDTKCEPSRKLSGKNTIFHEACLIPGNLKAMKAYVAKGKIRFRDEPHPIRAIIEQNKRARLQLSPVPLQRTSLTSNEGHPDMSTIYLRGGQDIMFTLRLLPLGAYTIPLELVIITKSFLAAHPLDPMSINTALQAMGVWLEIQRSDNLGPELAAYKDCDPRKVIAHPVPPVELEVFILGFPHFLRYTEDKCMTRHAHPYRLIGAGYRLDVKTHKSHVVPSSVLDQDRIGQLFDEMRGTARGLPANLTIPVLPASLPGTAMKWPTGVRTGEPPSRDLFSLCLLDDIRTLGLPSYHARTEDTQLVGISEPIVRNFGLHGPSLYVDVAPILEYWNPSTKGQLVSLSGTAESIGPVFKAVKGSEITTRYGAVGLLNEKDPRWLSHILPHSVEALMSRSTMIAIAKRNEKRMELAQSLKKKVSELRWDPVDMVLTWDGAMSEVVRAVGSGELPAARSPDPMDLDGEDEATALDEDGQSDSALFNHNPSTTLTIPPEDVKMLNEIIEGDNILAADWEPLREQLSTRRPLRKNVINLTHNIYHLLIEDVIKAGKPFWTEKPSEQRPNQLAMESAHDHFARMVGVVTHAEKQNAKEIWDSLQDQIPEEEVELWEVLGTTIQLLKNPRPKTWNRVMLSLEEVYTSRPFISQVSAIMKLLVYLGDYPDTWPEGFTDPYEGK